MAIVWIKEVRNYHPTATLKLRCDDGGRHPRVSSDATGKALGGNDKPYGRDQWITIGPRPAGREFAQHACDNFAVPWSFNFAQKLHMQVLGELESLATAEVRGEGGWDYMFLRDGEYREIGKVDVGSLGDAWGTNHSWWILALHSDGALEFHCVERQGFHREEALALLQFFLSFSLDVADTAGKAVTTFCGSKKDLDEARAAKKKPAAPAPAP